MSRGIGGHHRPTMDTDRWLTPLWIIEALGHFDLDPAGAPNHHTADVVITPESGDGLADDWVGRVWLNPPYGSATAVWLQRLKQHGHGTALIFARTETKMFFDHVWGAASAVLFLRGRLTFLRPDLSSPPGNSGATSVLIAYGSSDAEALRVSDLPGAYVDLSRMSTQTQSNEAVS